MVIEHALESVLSEYKSASKEFGAFASAHEGVAVILEEFEELKVEVFKNPHNRDRWSMRTEATHVAAMAIRFLVDVC